MSFASGSFGGWLSWMWAKGTSQDDGGSPYAHRVLGPDADHEKAARGMFSAYGRYWAETFWFRPRRVEECAPHTSPSTGDQHLVEANA